MFCLQKGKHCFNCIFFKLVQQLPEGIFIILYTCSEKSATIKMKYYLKRGRQLLQIYN